MISSNLKLHKILLVLLFVGSLYSQTLTRRVWIDSLFYNDGTHTYVNFDFDAVDGDTSEPAGIDIFY